MLVLHWGYIRVRFVFLVVLRAAFLQTYLTIRDLDPQGLLPGTERSWGLQDKHVGQGVSDAFYQGKLKTPTPKPYILLHES